MTGAPATSADPQSLSAAELSSLLALGTELAPIDVREEPVFARSHLLQARMAPLSCLEPRVALLVPRRSAKVVLVDEGEGRAQRAATLLARQGYTDLAILEGGVAAWRKAGHALFSGVNVPGKAFGEFVENAYGTPFIEPAELKGLLEAGADVLVLDSRTFEQYSEMSIPGAISVPGAELVLRVRDLVRSESTTVVVNCAGRTRSILGAQSLINAALPNKVLALRNGAIGWTLAGLVLDHGKSRRASAGPPSAATLAWAQGACERIARHCGVKFIDQDVLRAFQAEAEQRTLYVFDVRDPREYAAGHVRGARCVPGGQLVQNVDAHIGVLNARVVLVDELRVRAVMTASWLLQMGWKDVFVLPAAGNETAAPEPPAILPAQSAAQGIDPAELARLLESGRAALIDLSCSRAYRKGRIRGAWFAMRGRLQHALPKLGAHAILILTSEDGLLAALALEEAGSLTRLPVRYLRGGNAAWNEAGYPLIAEDPRFADEPLDTWISHWERPSPAEAAAAMQEYISWELGLLRQMKEDGDRSFRKML